MIWMFLSGVLSGVLFGASYVWSICAESSGAAETDDDVRLAFELGFKRGRADGFAERGNLAAEVVSEEVASCQCGRKPAFTNN